MSSAYVNCKKCWNFVCTGSYNFKNEDACRWRGASTNAQATQKKRKERNQNERDEKAKGVFCEQCRVNLCSKFCIIAFIKEYIFSE